MSVLNGITRPTLLLDEGRVRRNIQAMTDTARRSGVRFRPHFKTHQSATIGMWFREAGVEAITVSSVEMAEYFAEHGWRDILVASPVSVREAAALDRLASRVTLHVPVDSVEAVNALGRTMSHPVDLWIEIDTGDHRTGIAPLDGSRVVAVARAIEGASQLRCAGLIAHDGHTYGIRDRKGVEAIYRRTLESLLTLRRALEQEGMAPVAFSIGDTPTCRMVEDLSAVDEIRPGNFVFGDLTQLGIGSCREDEIAVALACPVVSKNEERGEIVVHGGGVHLSKDSLQEGSGGTLFGQAVPLDKTGWKASGAGAPVVRLSQELAVIRVDEDRLSQVAIGDLLAILPVHSCLTAHAMRSYLTLSGERIPCFGAPCVPQPA